MCTKQSSIIQFMPTWACFALRLMLGLFGIQKGFASWRHTLCLWNYGARFRLSFAFSNAKHPYFLCLVLASAFGCQPRMCVFVRDVSREMLGTLVVGPGSLKARQPKTSSCWFRQEGAVLLIPQKLMNWQYEGGQEPDETHIVTFGVMVWKNKAMQQAVCFHHSICLASPVQS